jgi:hypothetical protein
MNAKIGQDIAAMCHRCGESWHVVISMLERKLAKVECKQCHTVHRYKAPPSEAAKARAPKAAAGTRKAAAGGKRSSRASAARAPLIEADLSKPARPYSALAAFEPGERILHPTFGEGIAQQSPGPGKIEVLFGSDRKLLAQAKPVARLFHH